MRFMIQPAAFTDQLREGQQLTKLPYPYYVKEDGSVERQDYWQGRVTRVIGFAGDLAVERIDLPWRRAVADPQKAVGMYLVTADSSGDWSTHQTAVDRVDVIPQPGEAPGAETPVRP